MLWVYFECPTRCCQTLGLRLPLRLKAVSSLIFFSAVLINFAYAAFTRVNRFGGLFCGERCQKKFLIIKTSHTPTRQSTKFYLRASVGSNFPLIVQIHFRHDNSRGMKIFSKTSVECQKLSRFTRQSCKFVFYLYSSGSIDDPVDVVT